ncbi:MAG TPA: hypothetical protein ENH32_01945 [Proteobacteria bacterium]|nr:hypothetical protein [Pseudomonadota bacterium]
MSIVMREWLKDFIDKRSMVWAIPAFLMVFGMAAGQVHAGELVREKFDVLPSQAAAGSAPGRDGPGWTQNYTDWKVRQPVFLDYPVSFEGVRRGVISFDLQRKPVGIPELRSVFALKDSSGENLFLFQVAWSPLFNPKRPMVHLKGSSFYELGLGLWSPWILLDSEVQAGQWIHVDLIWDDTVRRYDLFVDGRPQDTVLKFFNHIVGKIQPDPRLGINREKAKFGLPPRFTVHPFSDILSRAVKVRLGINTVPNDPGFGTSPLANAVIDNFTIRVNDVTAIDSITHDAFAVAGMSGYLVAGDTVTVVEKADPGGKASFDIVRPASTSGGKTNPEKVIVSDIAMTESVGNPGTYVGAYTVKPGDHVEDGRVVGHFVDNLGFDTTPLTAVKPISIDGTVHLAVNPSNDLIPADESSRSGLTIVASDANGKHVRDHSLKLTMSTTDEYTGTVGGGTFEDNVGGKMEVDWRGVTDSFGEVTAQYVSGFAAKTILVSAKDMTTGDVGVGYIRAYIDGTVDIVVKRPFAVAQAISGSMEVSASRSWLTADGRSRSRITAVVKDASGHPVEGDNVSFNLMGDNDGIRRGSIRVVRSRTDSRGRATADYIAGTVMGQVQIEVRDMTSGLVSMIAIELRPDAPAEISLTADPGEVYIGGKGSAVTAKVTDVNGNPNADTDVLFEVIRGEGSVSAPADVTDGKNGVASVTFLPGKSPGVSTIKGTVISRPATDKEIAVAKGAVFLYGLAEDPGRLEVTEWFAKPGDEVAEGQDLVTLEDRHGETYTVKAPRDGVLATFVAEERDRVEYGQTLGYILPAAE